MSRAGIGLLWLLHFLPWPWLSALGRGLGGLAYHLAGSRRRVTLTNLKLCFPELSDAERGALARRHFRALGQVVMAEGIAFWGSRERLQRLVPLEGVEHWLRLQGTPVILLVPHFLGLDVGAVRLASEWPACSMYRTQSNPHVDALLRRSRTRFHPVKLLSRRDGIRGVVGAIQEGLPFYYLPDQDFGPRDAIFVPFFGVPAATITGLSRLARLTGARVLPVVTRVEDGGRGFRVTFYPPWEDFPGESVEADTRRMNAFIEERVREIPEQYLWLHRRFKTRPPGAPGVY
ncbi:MAG: lysophospholipid acyltransferase family protein [Pseudomonadota bacterium]